jgi:GT2 family glycosyltransferase
MVPCKSYVFCCWSEVHKEYKKDIDRENLSTYYRKHSTQSIQKKNWMKNKNSIYHSNMQNPFSKLHMHIKILIKNKWTINNLYLYIYWHPIWHLWASCFFVYFWSTAKNIRFARNHLMNNPTKIGSNWLSVFREKD